MDYDSDESEEAVIRGRRNIRKIIDNSDLQEATWRANAKEEERKRRIESRNKELEQFYTVGHHKLILDYDNNTHKKTIVVDERMVSKMKEHQRKGVKFMWDSCYESLDETLNTKGSGCILAHCMGLGKTFQVIALIHTILKHSQLKQTTVLICCPKSTVLNWVQEFSIWVTHDIGCVNVFNLASAEKNTERLDIVKKWQREGGVCITNYELFRILTSDNKKGTKKLPQTVCQQFQQNLCDPGADLVICDEGHMLKNENSRISKAMNKVATFRRIILTGTPMQNNLREYHCMVQFVKPSLLGSKREFLNMFVNPILNGQYENSLSDDVKLMKERSFVLHKTLSGCIQRYDYETLLPYLPPKQEFVISLRLSECQKQLCQYYLDYCSASNKFQSCAVFADYQALQRIWSHPYTLKLYEEKFEQLLKNGNLKKNKKKNDEGSDDTEDSEDETPTASTAPLAWWKQIISLDEALQLKSSTKFHVLFEIINECEENGEKMLVFSNSLYTIRTIEYYLKQINDESTSWQFEQDYYTLTGATKVEDRARYCREFNNEANTRSRLFLISTKAGGLGINLTGANRAVIFDASWNPSYDIQSIFRIFRLGQKKECFVYRLLAAGTMEEIIYERQVTKQSISHRVVDEKQITRHYTATELQQLYQFEPDKLYNPLPSRTQDTLMNQLLNTMNKMIGNIHEHDTLLEHRQDEELHEVDKIGAWSAYNSVNTGSLNTADCDLVHKMATVDIDVNCLQQYLTLKYKDASEEELNEMVDQVLPQLIALQRHPNIKELLEREILRSKYNPQPMMYRDDVNENNIPGTSGPQQQLKRQTTLAHWFNNKQQARNRNVLNSWGVRGGVAYGVPELW